MVCGLLGLERKRMRRRRQNQNFHRRGKSTIGQRAIKKLNGKTSWFKTKPKDAEEEKVKRKENKERTSQEEEKKFQKDGNTTQNLAPKAVIFVPYTPNSELAKELRKVEDVMETLSGMRMKVVEKARIQLKRILVKTNPWAGTDCQRDACLICQTREETGVGKGKPCHKRNVIYQTLCELCKERDGKQAEKDGKDA